MTALFDKVEFQAGVRFGLVALGVGLLLGAVWRATSGRRCPGAGVLFAGAALASLRAHADLPDELLLGVGALALAGLSGDVFHAPLLVRGLLSVPGALLVGQRTDIPGESWVGAGVTVVCIVGGMAAADFDRRWRRPPIAPGLVALTALGVFATVPDTELSRAVIAPAVLVALLGWPAALLRLGSAGAFAAVGVLAWVTAVDGIGRPGSVVGGLAAIGLLAAEPLARVVARFRGPLVPSPRTGAAIAMGAGQAVLVFVAARVVGFRESTADAVVLAVPLLAVAVASCAASARLLRRNRDGATGERAVRT